MGRFDFSGYEMNFSSDTFFWARHITHSHKNDYLNDRLNAQRVLAIISLLVPLALLFLYLLAPHTSDTGAPFILMGISCIVIANAAFRLILNWKKPRKDLFQTTSALLDFLGMAAILVGYAFIYDVPISVALKSPTANMFFVFLASRVVLLNGPIMLNTCGAAIATWAALTVLAVFEPDFAGRTSSYVEYLTSFKVLLGAEVERILQFIIISAILYTFIYLMRHDPGTGYFRRPTFLQSVAKFLNDSKRKTPKHTNALIELRITSHVSTDKIYNTVFSLVSSLPVLKTVKVVKLGKLSNRNVAVWISYTPRQINLDDFANTLLSELTQAAKSQLGNKVPPIIIGGSLFNYKLASEEQLAFTDIAIRDAINNGKTVRIFDEEIRARMTQEDHVRQLIHNGLKHDLFSVHYQPIVDLMTNKPVGFEALIRLSDRTGKNISPHIFIPIAENAGLIGDITDHLSAIVANDAPVIHDIFQSTDIEPYININVSPQQLKDIDRTLAALKTAQSCPVTINVEITESSVLNEANALEQIEKLKKAGYSLAIDDFGTGYSSIHRLEQLNVSTIKIDQCFTQNIEDRKGYAFLEAIINLSRITSQKVIIEGVETLPQKLLLMKMGVRYCQGYFFAKPMTLDNLEDYLSGTHGIERSSQKRIGHIASF